MRKTGSAVSIKKCDKREEAELDSEKSSVLIIRQREDNEFTSPNLRKNKLRKSSLGSARRILTPAHVDKENNPIQLSSGSGFMLIDRIDCLLGFSATKSKSRRKSSDELLIEQIDCIIGLSATKSTNGICNTERETEDFVDRMDSSAHSLSPRRKSYRADVTIGFSNATEESLKRREWTVDDFAIGHPLGKGKFGHVYHARQKLTSAQVALKVLFKAPMISCDSINLLRREVEIQCRLKHANIARLFGYFQDVNSVYLILEYLPNGNLYKYITSNGRVTDEITCRKYMKQVASAMLHMHQRYVYHRDLKPENLLIAEDGTLKLADFGWAVHAPKPLDTRFTICGTPEYVAPEMISGSGHNHCVDLWAMGVLMYELLYGRTPFSEKAALSNCDGLEEDASEQASISRIYLRIRDHDGSLKFPSHSRSSSSLVTGNIALPGKCGGSYSSSCTKVAVSRLAQKTIDDFLQPEPENRLCAADFLACSWAIDE